MISDNFNNGADENIHKIISFNYDHSACQLQPALRVKAQNQLHAFPRNFLVDGEAADLARRPVGASPQQVGDKSL